MKNFSRKIAILLLPLTLSGFLVFFAAPEKASAAALSQDTKCTLRQGINAGLGAIAGGGNLTDTIKSIGDTIISAGLDKLLTGATGGLSKLVEGVLGGSIGGFLGGLFGSSKPSGDDDSPITTKQECNILEARTLLETFNRVASQRLYDELNKNYKIANYLAYGRRLAYKVYVTKEVIKRDQEEKIILRVNAARELGLIDEETAQTDLTPLYQRRAAAAARLPALYDPLSPEFLSYNLNNLTTHVLATSPMGQRLLGVNQGAKIASASQASADKNIENGSGLKDSLVCTNTEDQQEDCNIDSSASTVASTRDAQIAALANYQLNPPDWKAIAARMVTDGIVNWLHKKILEHKSSKFIDDVLY